MFTLLEGTKTILQNSFTHDWNKTKQKTKFLKNTLIQIAACRLFVKSNEFNYNVMVFN